MDDRKLHRLIRVAMLIEAGAPGVEHVRLEGVLLDWAQHRGYVTELKSLGGKRPDVLRRHGDGHLFVGDAKDATNETPENDHSWTRIENYVSSFAEALEAEEIPGGIIAIATNTEQAAILWVLAIRIMTRRAQIHRADGKGPTWEKVDEKTWITWW